jgi:hypothetical protein
MIGIVYTDTDRWPTSISSADGNVNIKCRRPKDTSIDQKIWCEALYSAVRSLSNYRLMNLDGETAITSLLKDLPEIMERNEAIKSVAYTEPNESSVYTWPDPKVAMYRGAKFCSELPNLPFGDHKWRTLPIYRGNYGPVSDVQFDVVDAILVHRSQKEVIWFVLLEASVFESRNDAILQKTAFVNVSKSGSYIVKESDEILENAGGGGPYDLIMRDLVVSAREDVIAWLPNHGELGNILLKIDLSSLQYQRIDTFRAPNPELIPVGRDVDVEVVKYLRRFPEHITQIPADSFEKIIAEILRSHGFSDIQLNVKNMFGEIDIVAFDATKEGRRQGYIIECKRYRHDRRVTLREAHVLAMKRILMMNQGIDRAMLVTTSDFTGPTRRLYDSAWGMELKAYDEVIEWLKTYKPPKGIYFI